MFNINNSIIAERLPEPLEKDELYKLLRDFKNGNIDVKNKIIEHNLKLVLYVINTKFSNLNYEKEDIVSIGVIGLIKAVNSYDIDRNTEFSTYAIRCISTEVLMFLKAQRKEVDTVSLNKPMWVSNENNITFEDITFENDELDEYINNMELREVLLNSINKLPEKYIKVVYLYFGFCDGKKYTQTEIAKSLNVSSQFVSVMVRKSIDKIRKDLIDSGFITENDINYEERFVSKSKSIYNYFSKYPKSLIDDSIEKLSKIEKYLLLLKYTETESIFKITEEQNTNVTIKIMPKLKRILKKPDINPLLKNSSLESIPIEINKDYHSHSEISNYYDEILMLSKNDEFIEMTNLSSFNGAMVTALKLGYVNNIIFSDEEISKALNIKEEDVEIILQNVIDRVKSKTITVSNSLIKCLKK